MTINRKNRKIFTVLATSTLLFLLCACGRQESGQKTLRQQGMEVIGLMADMVASEEYAAVVGADNNVFGNLREKIAEGDYSAPVAVYQLSTPLLREVLAAAGGWDIWDGLPDSLAQYLDARSAPTLINQLNALQGTDALAISSLYSADRTFVSDELDRDTIYLYTFQGGCPIAVAFTGGEDRAVSATGTFLLADGFDDASLEQIQSLLGLLGLDCSFELLEDSESR